MEAAALQRILDALEANIPARRVPLSDDELEMVRGLCLLTMKPMIYAANVAEGDLGNQVGLVHMVDVDQYMHVSQ